MMNNALLIAMLLLAQYTPGRSSGYIGRVWNYNRSTGTWSYDAVIPHGHYEGIRWVPNQFPREAVATNFQYYRYHYHYSRPYPTGKYYTAPDDITYPTYFDPLRRITIYYPMQR